jgi:hypothetical protein
LSGALRAAAKTAAEAQNERAANALTLLTDVALLGLEPANRSQPFQPFFVSATGERTFLPSDLDASEIHALGEFSNDVTLDALRGRLADIAWVYQRPRIVDRARVAIDSYCADSPEDGRWFHGNRERWERALVVCLELGKGGEDRLESIEDRLVAAVLNEQSTAGVRRSTAELLRENRLAEERRTDIAEILDKEAHAHLESSDPFTARDLLLEAAKWFGLSNNAQAAARVTAAAADTYVAEGELHETNATGGYLVAGTYYESAIRLLKGIPRKDREGLRVDERVQDLRRRITESHEHGLETMSLSDPVSVDITNFVEAARQSVSAKERDDALRAFCRLVPLRSADVWRKQAVDGARRFPLQTLFAGSQLSADGRTVARWPGVTPGDAETPEWRDVILHRAIQGVTLHISLCVQGGILPALTVLNAEHRFTERDLISLAAQSPVVPPGRERMVGRGLAAGFRHDFAVAVHLLTPQLEHIVRSTLRSAGIQTRRMDDKGIEMEVGLSTLMEKPEAERLLGNLAFELRAVFCEASGFNLRNDLAHGLLDDSEMVTAATVYAWWFCLRLVMLPFLNSPKDKGDQEESA